MDRELCCFSSEVKHDKSYLERQAKYKAQKMLCDLGLLFVRGAKKVQIYFSVCIKVKVR